MATAPKPAADATPSTKGIFGTFTSVFSSAREVLANFAELITLEARRAGVALAWMMALAVAAALLIVTAWLGLVVAFALWLISLGMMTPAGAIALVAIVNLIVAVIIGFVCFLLSRNLLFPATRRQLKPDSSPSDAA
ncbi:MAG TPA: hypothetical protein VJS66_03760 [Burkholderiales bacterium]|nr:hypothetical protein [Burkholderiales bacterium]